jgi:esterase/lipase superfamily enzyme
MRAHRVLLSILLIFYVWFTSTNFAYAATEIRIPIWVFLLPAAPFIWAIPWTVRRARAADLYSVWYATNRMAKYGPDLNTITDKLSFGICHVAIPESHKFGSIGSSALSRFTQRLFTNTDDSLCIVRDELSWSEKGFLTSLSDALDRSGTDILVYIHGYNSSFETAIIRAAQIGFDLKVRGVTAAFCWASRGELHGYPADEDSVKLSERHLAHFLSLLNETFPTKKINILAHSMGNRALLGVLENLTKYPSLQNARFGQIFLAAPDIDARYFQLVASVYPTVSERTTLYVCAMDRALAVSGAMKYDARVGFVPPVTIVNGIDTVEATNVNLDYLGHGYYAEASAVLYDIAMLLSSNMSPATRPRLAREISSTGMSYWVLRSASG